MTASPHVDLVYFNAGGGHRTAAHALQDGLRRRQPQYACAWWPTAGKLPARPPATDPVR